MISIIICCYEEENIIRTTFERIEKIRPKDSEVIYVNDGSTDKTEEILKSLNANLVSYKENKGYGFALRQGLKKVQGDIIITLDCDLAMNPEEVITKTLSAMDTYDMIVFSRYKGVQSDYPLKRRIASLGYKLINKCIVDIPINDTQSGFIGFKREILKDINLRIDGFGVLFEFVAKTLNANYKVVEYPLKFVHQTKSGQTSVFHHLLPMFMDLWKVWGDTK